MNPEERLAAMERRISELEGKEGIRDTIGRYAQGVDENNPDELKSIFTEDCDFYDGWRQSRFQGKEEIVNTVYGNYWSTFRHQRRHIVNERINVKGTIGTASAYFFVLQAQDGESCLALGDYNWEFRLEDGVWKIARMEINMHTATTLERGWAMDQGRVSAFPSSPASQ